MFAAREGDIDRPAALAAGAEINAIAGDGKDALGLAIFNGHYDLAALLLTTSHSSPADTQGFTPLFLGGRIDATWRPRPNFPWMVTAAPLPLIKKRSTPAPTRMRSSTTRRAHACAPARLGRVRHAVDAPSISGDLELTSWPLYKANPAVVFQGRRDMVEAAAASAHPGLQQGTVRATTAGSLSCVGRRRAGRERRRRLRHHAADGGRELGDTKIISIGRRRRPLSLDLGKRTTAPSAPRRADDDHGGLAIGVGRSCRTTPSSPREAVALMTRLMKEKGIAIRPRMHLRDSPALRSTSIPIRDHRGDRQDEGDPNRTHQDGIRRPGSKIKSSRGRHRYASERVPVLKRTYRCTNRVGQRASLSDIKTRSGSLSLCARRT